MHETVRVENLVLGGGEAGKYIAWELAEQGRSVVVIERAWIGGSCPNVACLPSKNVIRSAKVAALLRQGDSYGVRTGAASTDMEGVRRRKREMECATTSRASGARPATGSFRTAPSSIPSWLASGSMRPRRSNAGSQRELPACR